MTHCLVCEGTGLAEFGQPHSHVGMRRDERDALLNAARTLALLRARGYIGAGQARKEADSAIRQLKQAGIEL